MQSASQTQSAIVVQMLNKHTDQLDHKFMIKIYLTNLFQRCFRQKMQF